MLGWPVAGRFARTAVYYQLIRFFSHLRVKIIVEHPQGGFLMPALAGQLTASGGSDLF